MNKVKYTPWQLWAQSYIANNEAFEGGLIDSEDADRYAHAAWNACRAKCLEIIGKCEEYECIKEEIEKL